MMEMFAGFCIGALAATVVTYGITTKSWVAEICADAQPVMMADEWKCIKGDRIYSALPVMPKPRSGGNP